MSAIGGRADSTFDGANVGLWPKVDLRPVANSSVVLSFVCLIQHDNTCGCGMAPLAPMGDDMAIIKASVLQAGTVALDTDATLAKAEAMIAEVGGIGAVIAVLPEGFVG